MFVKLLQSNSYESDSYEIIMNGSQARKVNQIDKQTRIFGF